MQEKGASPPHIEYEPCCRAGHDANGERTDMLIRDTAGKPLLMVACMPKDAVKGDISDGHSDHCDPHPSVERASPR